MYVVYIVYMFIALPFTSTSVLVTYALQFLTTTDFMYIPFYLISNCFLYIYRTSRLCPTIRSYLKSLKIMGALTVLVHASRCVLYIFFI